MQVVQLAAAGGSTGTLHSCTRLALRPTCTSFVPALLLRLLLLLLLLRARRRRRRRH